MVSKIAIVLACLCAAAYAQDFELENDGSESLADTVVSRSKRGTCSYDGCNSFCRKLGHARGVCIGTYCQCRFRRRRSLVDEQNADIKEETIREPSNVPQPDVEDSANEALSLADALPRSRRGTCGTAECSAHCRKLGHVRGVCIGNYCQCRSQ